MTIHHMNIHQETSEQGVSSSVLTTPEAARYLGLSASTLNRWRCYGTGPKYLKLGRAVRYRADELDAFLEAKLLRSTVDTAGRTNW